MPIFEYLCLDCGKASEILMTTSGDQAQCQACGSNSLKKMISAHSSLSGGSNYQVPGPGDTACGGSSPTQAGCAGPGSCCGKALN